MSTETIHITLNGSKRALDAPGGHLSVLTLIDTLELGEGRVAVELNGEVIPRNTYERAVVTDGDAVEIVTFVGGGDVTDASNTFHDEPLVIGSHSFQSRLFLGTGKYKDNAETLAALEASGTEVVTVALRRVDLERKDGENLLDALGNRWTLLPNTAGCYTAEDAVRTLRLARELGISDLVKLEVLADPQTLLPDVQQTLVALQTLVKEDFTVLVYTNDDPVMCRRLEEAGAAAVMPLGSAIGTGLGILNPINLELIVAQSRVPVIVDAGVGTASDVAVAMELGCDGVLLNTGVAKAQNPVLMAAAMRDGCTAGRLAWRAGRMPKGRPTPSSPPEGTITSGAPTSGAKA